MKHTRNLLFSEKRLAYNLGNSPKLSSSAEKVPASVCKKADARYFSIIKKAGKLNTSTFQKRLRRNVLPQVVKKAATTEVNKTKFLYPTQQAFDAKVAKVSKKLIKLISKENIRIQSSALGDLRAQAQGDIKNAAQKAAGFQENSTDDISVSTNRMAQYKGIITKMNGSVPKAKLLNVAKNYKKIAISGIDDAINKNTQGMMQSKIRKHMTTALNA